MVQWLRLLAPNAGGLGSIPGQGTRSCMVQLRACMPQLKIRGAATKILQEAMKILCAAANTQRSQINNFFFLIFKIYFWLCWVFVAARGLSLVVVSGSYSSLQCTGFSLQWLLLLWSTGSRYAGFSSCSMQAQQLWLMGSRAQAH